MSRVKYLESKRLIKEFEYIQSDFNYKMELVSEADNQFLKTLNFYLDSNPKLKEIFDQKISSNIDQIFKKKEIEKNQDKESDKDEFEFFSDDEIEVDVKKTKLKKLYRQIVKTTHPDKIKNDRLNELYLKATKYYSDNDFAGTYSICSELNIEFEVDDEERNLISDQILNMKNRIEFIEKTMSWRWFNSDDVQKQKIMFEYLKIRLNN